MAQASTITSSKPNLVLVFLGVDLSGGLQEDAGQRFHDVGLVHHRDLLAALSDRVVEGEADDAAAALAGVDAGAHAHRVRIAVDRNEVLVAHVQAFVVLAHQHQVDVVIAAARNDGVGGAQVCVELEFLAQAHVRRAVTTADGSFQRSLEGEPGLADAVETGRGQWVAASRDAGGAGDLLVPNEGSPEGIKDLEGGRGDFRADAIARDKGGRNRRVASCLHDSRLHSGLFFDPTAGGSGQFSIIPFHGPIKQLSIRFSWRCAPRLGVSSATRIQLLGSEGS